MTLTKKYYIEGHLVESGSEILYEGDRYNNLILKGEGDTGDKEQEEVEKLVNTIMTDLEEKDKAFCGQNDKNQMKKDTVDYIKGVIAETGKTPEKDEITKFLVGRSPGFAK